MPGKSKIFPFTSCNSISCIPIIPAFPSFKSGVHASLVCRKAGNDKDRRRVFSKSARTPVPSVPGRQPTHCPASPRSAHDTSAHPCQTDTCYGLLPILPCPLRIFSTERQGATGAYLPHLSVPTPQPEESSLSFLRPQRNGRNTRQHIGFTSVGLQHRTECGNGRRRIICHLIGCPCRSRIQNQLAFSVQIAVSRRAAVPR